MKILAIRFARLGDVVLLLPALAALKDGFPQSELTFLTGHRCAPVAELCPAIDDVMSVDRIAMRDGPALRALWHMGALVRKVREKRFDMVVDFHSFRETNLLAWLSGSPVRIAMKRVKAPYLSFCFNRPPVEEDKQLHVAEMFQRVVSAIVSQPGGRSPLGSNRPLAKLVTTKAEEPTVALFVDAPVPERIWPAERFAQVADFAVEKLHAVVLVISGPERAELAERVRKASRHPDRLSTFSDLTLARLAGVMGSAHLLVSNDTGPMHIGPALGVPTLGLFSVGYPEHFRPTGPKDRFLRANPIEQIQAADVIDAVEAMWSRVDRDLPR